MLFDFDYTIVNRDSFATFVRFLFEQESWRKLLLLLFSPVLLVLGSNKKTMVKRNVMLIWISTLGMTGKRLEKYQRRFIGYFFNDAGAKAYDQALLTLRQHQKEGHKVFIVSGAAQWLLEPICQHLDIDSVTILGTSTRRFLGGLVTDFYCYKYNKVKKLDEMGVFDTYQLVNGYSDSAADIPMLKHCQRVQAINPKPSCLSKFNAVFGDKLTCHQWQ